MLVGNIDTRYSSNVNFGKRNRRLNKVNQGKDTFCLQNKKECYNKTGIISRIRGLFMNRKLSNFSSDLKNWIIENDIDRKTIESYNSCVVQAKDLEPEIYRKLCTYTPTIDKISYTAAIDQQLPYKEYITQSLLLNDPKRNICGTFDTKYSLNGEILDTNIDLYDL